MPREPYSSIGRNPEDNSPRK
jgi:hypothetical protein